MHKHAVQMAGLDHPLTRRMRCLLRSTM